MDIARLGYEVDSSGLERGNQALDETVAKADKAGEAAQRAGADYSAMAREMAAAAQTIAGGMSSGFGTVTSELQSLNRGQGEFINIAGQMRDIMSSLEQKFEGTGTAAGKYAASGNDAASAMQAQAEQARQLAAEIDRNDERYKSIAQRAMEYGESTRGANLSDRALAEAAREAAAGIDTKAEIMRRAGSEQEQMARRVELMRASEERLAKQQNASAQAAGLQEVNLRKLLGQIDPTIAKLDQLADMEGRLERALELGAISPKFFDQYQAKIDATRAATLNAGKASDVMTKSLGNLNLQSVETQQSLAALVRAVATGQWGQAQSSITSLTARTGAMGSMFGVAGIAIVGTAAAAGTLAVMAAKGYVESRQLDGIILGMGGSADATTGKLLNLRREIGQSTGDYQAAGAAINQLVLSGKTAGDQLEMMASIAASSARLTGQSISSTTSEVLALGDGGAEALVKLNDKYGFLTLATYRQIEAMRVEKGDAEAVRLALIELEREQDNRTRAMVERAGWLEQAYHGVRRSIAGAIDAMKDLGRSDAEYQYQQALRQMENMRAGAGLSDPDSYGPYVKAREEANRALAALIELDAKENERARKRKMDSEQIRVEADAQQASKGALDAIEAQIAGLDRQSAALAARNRIIEQYNKLSITDPGNARHFDGSMQRLIAEAERKVNQQFDRRDGVNKQDPSSNLIQRLQRQIALNNEQISSEEKLTATERMLVEVRLELDRIAGKASASNRALAESLIEQARASGEAAAGESQRRKDLEANAAMVERLAQAERLRREQAQVELMGIGRGSDVAERLKRELEIQRLYLQEVEKLDKAQRNRNTALSANEYKDELALLAANREQLLAIERAYQQQRQELLGDWRSGFTRVWEDYIAAAANASEQSASLLVNSLSAGEDAFVKLAQTGKLSFTSLANSIIADLARIGYQKAIVGLFSMFTGGGQYNGMGQGTAFDVSAYATIGKRENGGPTNRGQPYQVGERNKPELFTAGGKQFLIPGDHGRVDPIPATPVGRGGMGNPQVNITVQGNASVESATATPNRSGGFDLTMIMKEVRNNVAADIANGGVVAQAGKARFGWRETV